MDNDYDSYWSEYKKTILGLVEVEITSGKVMDGDSGGPIYIASSGGSSFCGVLSCSPKDSDGNASTTTYAFSPYEYFEKYNFQVQTTS